jgi:hypothetical protein
VASIVAPAPAVAACGPIVHVPPSANRLRGISAGAVYVRVPAVGGVPTKPWARSVPM